MWTLWDDMMRIEREVDRLFEEVDRFFDRAFGSTRRMLGSSRPEPIRGSIRPAGRGMSEQYEARWSDPRGRWQVYVGGSYTVFEGSPESVRRRRVRRVIPVEDEDSERGSKQRSARHGFHESDVQDVPFEEVD